jgi:hypothetical protein
MSLWAPNATPERVATWSMSPWAPNATPEGAQTWSMSLWAPNATPERALAWPRHGVHCRSGLRRGRCRCGRQTPRRKALRRGRCRRGRQTPRRSGFGVAGSRSGAGGTLARFRERMRATRAARAGQWASRAGPRRPARSFHWRATKTGAIGLPRATAVVGARHVQPSR